MNTQNYTKNKKILIFISIFCFCFLIDQYVKFLFVGGLEHKTDYISFILVYNYGVAFSMFAFIGEYLKYIQLSVLLFGGIYLYFNKEIISDYYISIALLLAGGLSNIFDRFYHDGVVDYIYYHHWFEFAVFNLADVFIDLAIIIILFKQYKEYKNN
jgi:signal peptidase II